MILNFLLSTSSSTVYICVLILATTNVATTSLDLHDDVPNQQQEYLVTVTKICPEGCTCTPNPNEENVSVLLDCNDRNLTEIPKFDKQLPAYKLDVGRNEISTLKAGNFDSFTNIEILLAFINEIETVDENAFDGLKDLKEIDLSDNLLFFIHPDTFKTNINLRKVTLFGNSLVQVPGNAPILNAPFVTDLDISFCKLTSLTPESFKNLQALETLDISSNDLKSLSVDTLKQIATLKSVRLENNRWSCDCNLTALLNWVTSIQLQNKIAAHKPVRCVAPGGGVRKLWSVSIANKLDCQSSEVEIPKINNNCTNTKSKRDTIGCSFNKITTKMEATTTTNKIVTTESNVDTTTENTATVFSNLIYFLEKNCELIFVVLLSIVVFIITVLFAYLCVKRVLRSNNAQSSDTNNGRSNLAIAFGGDLTKKRDSSAPLLEPSEPETRCPPTPGASRQQRVPSDHPPSLYLEYMNARPHHVYEVIH